MSAARLGTRRLPGPAIRWLAIFGVSLGLLLIRFLVPTPVGQADNRDGPRLTCGIGLSPVTSHHPRFFRFAYFEYVRSPGCAGYHPYPSSELVAMEVSRLLTPVFGLPSALNLIAVGVLWCVLASVGIAQPGHWPADQAVGPSAAGRRGLADHRRRRVLRRVRRPVQ